MRTVVKARALLIVPLLAGIVPGHAEELRFNWDVQLAQYRGATWAKCAEEDGFCSVPYTTVVRFGAGGTYVTLQVTGGVQCSTKVFGDPVYRTQKHCDFAVGYAPSAPSSAPQYCAEEGQRCSFRGTAQVIYGIGDRVRVGTFTNGTACTNQVFGDPAPGQKKYCYVAP